MENKIIEIANELFNAPVSKDTKIGDIDSWDSLGQLNLFMALESKLNMNFAPDEVIENDSIEKIILLVESKKESN
jgi:acyl carrier protein